MKKSEKKIKGVTFPSMDMGNVQLIVVLLVTCLIGNMIIRTMITLHKQMADRDITYERACELQADENSGYTVHVDGKEDPDFTISEQGVKYSYNIFINDKEKTITLDKINFHDTDDFYTNSSDTMLYFNQLL